MASDESYERLLKDFDDWERLIDDTRDGISKMELDAYDYKQSIQPSTYRVANKTKLYKLLYKDKVARSKKPHKYSTIKLIARRSYKTNRLLARRLTSAIKIVLRNVSIVLKLLCLIGFSLMLTGVFIASIGLFVSLIGVLMITIGSLLSLVGFIIIASVVIHVYLKWNEL